MDQVSRVPPAAGAAYVVDRVIELINGLEEAFAAPPKPGEERKPVIDALVEVARFARAVGCSQAVRGLSDLAYALKDLDGGQVAPVVKRRKPKGNPPDSSLLWMKRTYVLVAMHALQKADPDLKLAPAAKHIAQKYPGLQRLLTRGKDLPDAILDWRRKLEEAKRDTFHAQFFEHMDDMEKFVAQQSRSPDQLRQFAHNTLARI